MNRSEIGQRPILIYAILALMMLLHVFYWVGFLLCFNLGTFNEYFHVGMNFNKKFFDNKIDLKKKQRKEFYYFLKGDRDGDFETSQKQYKHNSCGAPI